MSKYENLVGKRYGFLLVQNRENTKGKNSKWKCKCDCGKEVIVYGYNLKSGHTKSCGCLQRKRTSEAVKKHNTYDLTGEIGIGYTTNNNSIFYFDKEDYETISMYTWLENDQGYIVARNIKTDSPQFIRMHRLVLGASGTDLVDHKNLIRFDNRKSNLRFANKQLNGINRPHNSNSSTGVKGVENYGDNKYIARIMIDGRSIHIGIFDNIEEAKQARLEKEIELFGEFAYLEGDNYELHSVSCS